MAIERVRESVKGSVSQQHVQDRIAQGWRLVALEWERGSSSPGTSRLPIRGMLRQAIPYGLRVAADCEHLEEDPLERSAMELMLQLIVEDQSLSQVAAALNQSGFKNRRGDAWTQTMVFNLLPRLIEVAPEIRIPETLSNAH